MCFCKESILISSHFSWQMARVVGGAPHVRMFLHMFLIPILVSVVSLFLHTLVCVAVTLCIVPYFPAQERQCAGRALEVTNETSEPQRLRHDHMHVVCTQLESQAFVFLADCSGDRPSHHAHQITLVFSLEQSQSDGRRGHRLLLTSNCNSIWNSRFG